VRLLELLSEKIRHLHIHFLKLPAKDDWRKSFDWMSKHLRLESLAIWEDAWGDEATEHPAMPTTSGWARHGRWMADDAEQVKNLLQVMSKEIDWDFPPW